MLTGLLLAGSLTAVVPPPAPAPELDARRFELHLTGRGGLRALGGVSGGGGAHFGLGVRLWRGLYLEAGLGEALFTNPSSPSSEGFRHLGEHDETPAPDPAPELGPTDPGSEQGGLSAVLAGQILLGLRYEIRRPTVTRVRPSVFLGLTHMHEATLSEFLDTPGKALSGTGSFIRHRTGAQLGVGLRVPFPARWGTAASHFSGRFDLDAAYYFDALPGRVQLGLGAGIQAVF